MSINLKSFCLLTGLFTSHIFAQPGKLDSSFGINGKVTYSDGASSQSIAIQKDGKIVVAGYKFSSEPFITKTFLLYRLNADGSIDSTFGTSGKIEFLPAGSHDGFVGDLKIQADNKILLGGTLFVVPGSDFFLARFNERGTFDSSFGTNGIVVTNIKAGEEDILLNLNFKENNKILACGSGNGVKEMASYNADGSLDQSFGDNGVIYDASSFAIYAAKTFSDGRFVTANPDSYSPTSEFLITKYKSTGFVDSSFGNNGKTFVDFGGDADVKSMSLTNSGLILAGGSVLSGERYFPVITRVSGNGTIDASFGNNGKVILDLGGNQTISSILNLYDNKILIVVSDVYAGSQFIARLLSNGAIDSSFGNSGIVVINLSSWNGLLNYNLNCITLQQDDKILITGGTYFNIYRYQNEQPVYVSLVKNVSVVEGNTGTTPVQFKVALDKPAASDVFVNYTTKDLTASAGSDYIAALGTLRIKSGKTKGAIRVNIIGDNIKEKTEGFALVLSNPINAVLGNPDSVNCTIKNDDASFNLSSTSSNAAIKSNNFLVFPNPVHDVLNLQGLDVGVKSELRIMDITGKILARKKVNASTLSWNISALPDGNYLLQILTYKMASTIPFVKQ